MSLDITNTNARRERRRACSTTVAKNLSATRGGFLRRLERVLRADLFLANALTLVRRARGGLGHDDVLVRRAGHRAADEDAVVVGQDLEQLEVLRRDALVAHLAGHALALVDALRSQPATDRSTVTVVLVRAV